MEKKGGNLRGEKESTLRPGNNHIKTKVPTINKKRVLHDTLQIDIMTIKNAKIQNVRYVMAAEFSTSSGPVLKYQYPPSAGKKELPDLAELMIPDQSHSRDEDMTVIILHEANFQDGHDNVLRYTVSPSNIVTDQTNAEVISSPKTYYVYNLVKTKFNKQLTRGVAIKSVAIVTPFSFFRIFKPLLFLCINKYFDLGTIEPLAELYKNINRVNFDIFNQVQNDMSISYDSYRGNRSQSQDLSFERLIDYDGLSIPMRIPYTLFPGDIGEFSVKKLLLLVLKGNATFNSISPELTPYGITTPPLLVLLNALILGKRIVFLGHGTSSSYDMVQYSLSLYSIAKSGLLEGYRYSCFPYTDLSKIDEILSLNHQYIAGVLNPAFKNHPQWWDLLYDVEENTMYISEQGNFQDSTNPNINSDFYLNTLHTDLIEEDKRFLDLITTLQEIMDDDRAIRIQCQKYILEFLRMATSYNSNLKDVIYHNLPKAPILSGYGYCWKNESIKEIAIQRRLPMIQSYVNLIQNNTGVVSEIPTVYANSAGDWIDLDYHLDKNACGELGKEETDTMFVALQTFLRGTEAVEKLCHSLLIANERMEYIAMGLFHGKRIRQFAFTILALIKENNLGEAAFGKLNIAFKLEFERVKEGFESI